MTNISFAANPVLPGQNLTVTYTADDTLYSTYRTGVPSSTIDSIRYSFDKPSWISGSNAKTIVLRTQVPKYTSTFAASTTGLTPGQHTLFIESLDGSGAWGPPTAIFFTISEGGATPTFTPTATPTETPTATPTPPVDLFSIFVPFVQNVAP